MNQVKKERISINARVLKSTANAIKKLADKEGRSLNSYMQLVMNEHIEGRKKS